MLTDMGAIALSSSPSGLRNARPAHFIPYGFLRTEIQTTGILVADPIASGLVAVFLMEGAPPHLDVREIGQAQTPPKKEERLCGTSSGTIRVGAPAIDREARKGGPP